MFQLESWSENSFLWTVSNISNYQKWNKYFVYSAVLFWLFRSYSNEKVDLKLVQFLVTFNTIASCNVTPCIHFVHVFILWDNRDHKYFGYS